MDLLTAMRIYVRVVERRSMSAAARDLGMGQPAVSERIDRLERHLGVQLLRRNPRALACTDSGDLFYTQSKLAIAAADAACASVAQSDQVLRGTLRIAAPQCFGEVVMPPILLHMREQHPQLRFELILNDQKVDPVTEGVDLSIRLGEPGEGNFIAYRLGRLRRMLVAAPSYIARRGPVVAPADLVGHPFIHVTGIFGNGHVPLADAQGTIVQAPVDAAVACSHWRPMYELLLAGAGIGVVQQPACAAALADGRLRQLLPDYAVPPFELNVLAPASRPVPAKIRATVEILKTCLPTDMAQHRV